MKKVALILTGHPDFAEQSLPHYLQQIRGSGHSIHIFASIHGDQGHCIEHLGDLVHDFRYSRVFVESDSQKQLLMMLSRGHASIAEFASAVTHWRSELLGYDMIWRGRWDSYLQGNSADLDFLIDDCWNIGAHAIKVDPQRYRMLTRSLVLQHGRPAMEGKHFWATVPTVLAAFDDWERRWTSWITRIGSFRFDAHLTWAEIFAAVGTNVNIGNYTVEKVSGTTQHPEQYTDTVPRDIRMEKSALGIYNERLSQQRFSHGDPVWINLVNKLAHKHEIQTRQQQRQQQLEQKIKSQNPR